MVAAFRRYGIAFREERWSPTTKALAVDRFERWLRDGAVILPPHDTLRRQLGEYSEKVTRSGSLTYGGRGAHDDYAQVCITLGMADVHRLIPGSPDRAANVRHEAYA